MNINSACLCRASEKIYERLTVSDVPASHSVEIIYNGDLLATPLPCQLYECGEVASDGTRDVVAVCPIWPVECGAYLIGEYNEEHYLVSCVEHDVDFEHAKWTSRLNYRLHHDECYQIRNYDEGRTPIGSDGRTSLEVRQAIPAPDHIILRGTVALPYLPDRDLKILCINSSLERVADTYVEMGLFKEPVRYVPSAYEWVLHFSMNIPWNEPDLYLLVWDAAHDDCTCSYVLTQGECKHLTDELGDWFFRNAGMDPYYPEWFRLHQATPHELELQRMAELDIMSSFSIVVPLYKTPENLFREMLESVLVQSYQHWELILVNASPEEVRLSELVAQAYTQDSRVRCVTMERNLGISLNTNAGIAAATGDFVAFLDHDDVIEPDTLYEYAKAVDIHPDTDLLYCDEDKLTQDGNHVGPVFKTIADIDHLRCQNYVTHFLAIRRSLLDTLELGGPEYDGAQDYNLTLQAFEHARRITHVPRMLYHWRMAEGSTSLDPEAKPYALEAGMRSVREHLKRCGIRATVSEGRYPYYYDVNYLPPEDEPLVSIIVPTADHADVLRTCVDSIFSKSTYHNFEIVLVENNSHNQATFAYYDELVAQHPNQVRVERWEYEFNFSKLVNFGAQRARGNYLLLLNNDTEVITPDWIDRMLGISTRDDVGAVGVKLIYPDGTLQHAGVCVASSSASHYFKDMPRENHGYDNLEDHQRDLSAVTAACMMTSRRAFESVGGFDESFAVAYNDVDFCLRLREKGLLVVYTPMVELYHYESLSRGVDETGKNRSRYIHEMSQLYNRWSDLYAEGDPYYPRPLKQGLPDCLYYRF